MTWTGDLVAERMAAAASTLARSRAMGVGPSGMRSAWPSIAPTEEDRRLAYGYNAATAPRVLPTAAELSALDQVLGWVPRYLSAAALHIAGLPSDAAWVAWMRAQGHSYQRISAVRGRRHGSGRPEGGNSREAVRTIAGRAYEHVAAGLNRDRVPLHVGAVDAPAEPDPVLTGRAEAMPRQMDMRRFVTNRWPCGLCRHMRTIESITSCGTRGGAVAPAMRAQHPEGEPCFQGKPA
jgi:hypothetical protein